MVLSPTTGWLVSYCRQAQISEVVKPNAENTRADEDWTAFLVMVSETRHALTPLWCVRFKPRNPSEMPLVPVVPVMPVPVPVPVVPVLVPVPVPVPVLVPVPVPEPVPESN